MYLEFPPHQPVATHLKFQKQFTLCDDITLTVNSLYEGPTGVASPQSIFRSESGRGWTPDTTVVLPNIAGSTFSSLHSTERFGRLPSKTIFPLVRQALTPGEENNCLSLSAAYDKRHQQPIQGGAKITGLLISPVASLE